MRVLVTRAREDAEEVARRLSRRGVEPVLEPLLTIVPRAGAAVELDGVQAIVVTSANGVRALAAATSQRALPVLAVGDASARAARGAGFSAVTSAAGDVDALARLATERLDAAGGEVLHVAGSRVAGDLAGALAAAGLGYRRAVLYEARVARALSPRALRLLRDRAIDGALFFSPRAAATFVSLARQARLATACTEVTAFCLSPAVAAAAGSIAWRDVRVAERSDQEALLACIDAAPGRADGGDG